MTHLTDADFAIRLLTAAGLGALIGFERESRQKSAGLRTNILISVGSALFTLMSYELAAEGNGDPARIAAQIVTGIGFLGAGAIMRTGGSVQGLTTAATVWVNAGVGVAAGGGKFRLAVIATLVTLAALLVLTRVEAAIARQVNKGGPPAGTVEDPTEPPPPPGPGA